jgi:hypothetical protein
MTDRDQISWAISRLLDNYEWQDIIEPDEWQELQDKISDAIMADKRLALIVLNACLDNGIIEEE